MRSTVQPTMLGIIWQLPLIPCCTRAEGMVKLVHVTLLGSWMQSLPCARATQPWQPSNSTRVATRRIVSNTLSRILFGQARH